MGKVLLITYSSYPLHRSQSAYCTVNIQDRAVGNPVAKVTFTRLIGDKLTGGSCNIQGQTPVIIAMQCVNLSRNSQ